MLARYLSLVAPRCVVVAAVANECRILVAKAGFGATSQSCSAVSLHTAIARAEQQDD